MHRGFCSRGVNKVDDGALDSRLKAAEATSDRLFGRAHACMGPRSSGGQGAALSHNGGPPQALGPRLGCGWDL